MEYQNIDGARKYLLISRKKVEKVHRNLEQSQNCPPKRKEDLSHSFWVRKTALLHLKTIYAGKNCLGENPLYYLSCFFYLVMK